MNVKDWIQQSIETKKLLLEPSMTRQIEEIIELCLNGLRHGGKLIFCGNGGSAADAQHIAAELTVRYKTDRASLPGVALGTNFSHLTAAANDFGYKEVFSRELSSIGKEGDVLIALSTSGNSPNIIQACQQATLMKISTVGWTGHSGGQLKSECQYLLQIPSTEVPRIQECHLLIGHILCEFIDREFS